jgi:hypothetical protein
MFADTEGHSLPRKYSYVVHTSQVLFIQLTIPLEKEPGGSPFEKWCDPLGIGPRQQLQLQFRTLSAGGAELQSNGSNKHTPKGSAARRFPCIMVSISLTLSDPSPSLSHFVNKSSNFCATKRPSLSYIPVSEPC